jgi:hypothetical protein
VRRCFLQGLRAQTGTKTLCKLSGAQTDRILALGNDFSEAAQAFVLQNDVEKNALRQEANFLGR